MWQGTVFRIPSCAIVVIKLCEVWPTAGSLFSCGHAVSS